MSTDINNIVLTGRICNAPEIKETANTAVTNFRIAVNRRFAKQDQQQADFLAVTCFGKCAEFVAQYLDTGAHVSVVGRLAVDQVEKNGEAVFYTKIIADSVGQLETKSQAEARRAAAGKSGPPTQAQTAGEMDDPFGDQ